MIAKEIETPANPSSRAAPAIEPDIRRPRQIDRAGGVQAVRWCGGRRRRRRRRRGRRGQGAEAQVGTGGRSRRRALVGVRPAAASARISSATRPCGREWARPGSSRLLRRPRRPGPGERSRRAGTTPCGGRPGGRARVVGQRTPRVGVSAVPCVGHPRQQRGIGHAVLQIARRPPPLRRACWESRDPPATVVHRRDDAAARPRARPSPAQAMILAQPVRAAWAAATGGVRRGRRGGPSRRRTGRAGRSRARRAPRGAGHRPGRHAGAPRAARADHGHRGDAAASSASSRGLPGCVGSTRPAASPRRPARPGRISVTGHRRRQVDRLAIGQG